MSPAAETLEGRTRVLIEKILHLRAQFGLLSALTLQVLQEAGGGTPPGVLPGCASNRLVGGDDPDLLTRAVLRGEPFDHAVGLGSEAHREVAAGAVVAGSVEDHDAPSATESHEAREGVDQLLTVAELARVEDVVAVEEVEHLDKDAHMETERAYLAGIVERLRAILGDDLVGVYAGGSWALGGYERGRSDLDVAVVVRRALTDVEAEKIVARLRHDVFPCPARGIDLVVYTTASAATPTTEPGFELNLNTGARWTFRVDRRPQPGERHWFAIDRSVLAEHGLALVGPSPAEIFAPVPKEALRPLLAEVLRWYLREEPESEDAVLNAGRSLRFARGGVWLPKPALRSWAAAQPGTNAEILHRSIAELEAQDAHKTQPTSTK
jgi:hypothetical protein